MIRNGKVYNSQKSLTLIIPIDYQSLVDSWNKYKQDVPNYKFQTAYQKNAFDLVKQKENQIEKLFLLVFSVGRTKRGLFNFIGSIISDLTGNLSHEEGERLEQQILELYKSQQNLQENPREIIRLINETINNVQEQINTNLDTLTNYLKFAHTYHTLNDKFRYQSLYIQTLYDELQNLVLGLTFADRNKLYPILFDPEKLCNIINQIKLPPTYTFPYSLQVENILELEKVMSIKYYRNSHKVTFILTIPLLPNTFFVNYNMYSVPMHFKDSFFYEIELDINAIAINDRRFLYPSDCKMYKEDFMCQFLSEHSVTNNTKCVLNAVFNNDIDGCVKQIVEFHEIQFYSNNNVEFIIFPFVTNVKQNCNNEIKTLKYHGTYLLKNDDFCKYIVGERIVQNLQVLSNLSVEFLEYKNTKMLEVNKTQLKPIHLHLELNKTQDLLKMLEFRHRTVYVSHIVLYLVVIVIIIIVSLYCNRKAIRDKFKKQKENASKQRITHPLQIIES